MSIHSIRLLSLLYLSFLSISLHSLFWYLLSIPIYNFSISYRICLLCLYFVFFLYVFVHSYLFTITWYLLTNIYPCIYIYLYQSIINTCLLIYIHSHKSICIYLPSSISMCLLISINSYISICIYLSPSTSSCILISIPSYIPICIYLSSSISWCH